MLAVTDPWNSEAEGACVPKTPSRPSQKLTTYCRFQLQIGGITNPSTVGFIYVMPSLSSSSPSVLYYGNSLGLVAIPSDPTYLINLLPFATPVYTNSMYDSTDLTSSAGAVAPQVLGRVVSAGLSIDYFGSELYKGGTMTTYVSPNHDNLLGYAPSSINSAREAGVKRINDKKVWMVTSGLDDRELTYPDSAVTYGTANKTPNVYPFSNGQTINGKSVAYIGVTGTVKTTTTTTSTTIVLTQSTNTTYSYTGAGTLTIVETATAGNNPNVFTVDFTAASINGTTKEVTFTVSASTVIITAGTKIGTGTPTSSDVQLGGACMMAILQPANASATNGNVFQVEYIQHSEYIGPKTSTALTPTHSDAVGFEKVSNVVQRLPQAQVAFPNTPLRKLGSDLLRVVTAELAPVAIGGARAMGKSLAAASMNYLSGRSSSSHLMLM